MINLFSGILLTVGGVLMTLVGFKIIDVSRGVKKDVDKEKIDKWFKKYSLLLKIGGLFLLIVGLINIFL